MAVEFGRGWRLYQWMRIFSLRGVIDLARRFLGVLKLFLVLLCPRH